MDKPDQPPRKPPFEIPQAAMLLLGVLVIAGVVLSFAVVTRCVFWFVEAACSREWRIRDWLTDIIIVLVALIGRPPEPRE
jgi:hypothetical protein